MSVNMLRSALTKFCANKQYFASARYLCSQQPKYHKDFSSSIMHGTASHSWITFKPRTSPIDFDMPKINGYIKSIIDFPIAKIPGLEELPLRAPISLPKPNKSIGIAPGTQIIEKHAVRLIIIRRRKMRIHKRKKLRKRMHYTWIKIKQRRELLRETAFQAEMLKQLQEAQRFDAKAYVAERIHILTKERLPKTYRGEVLPEAMIRQFLSEKRAKKEAKRNKPRLSLD